MKIFVLHPGRANYPEIVAYTEYFEQRGWQVAAGTWEAYRLLPDKEQHVVWCIMGFYPRKLHAKFVIHDYRSLSVGSMKVLKDRVKLSFQARPDLRIFQNRIMRDMMNFRDTVETIYLPMGIPDWVFSRDVVTDGALPSGTYCYMGDISRERGVVPFITDFLANRSGEETLVLVGTVEKSILEAFQHETRLVFTGRLKQRDALAVVSNCDFAVSTIPYVRPYNVQTPTKLLEYAALGRRIICNDSPSNLNAVEEFGIQCKITGPRVFFSMGDIDKDAVPVNDPGALAHLRWGNVIARSGIDRYIETVA